MDWLEKEMSSSLDLSENRANCNKCQFLYSSERENDFRKFGQRRFDGKIFRNISREGSLREIILNIHKIL